MNNNQQPKPEPIKYTLKIPVTLPEGKAIGAIVSFVLGIVSVIPLMLFLYYEVFFLPSLPPDWVGEARMMRALLLGYLFYLAVPAGLIGLILGIISLKSTKNNLAIGGIGLCAIGLFSWSPMGDWGIVLLVLSTVIIVLAVFFTLRKLRSYKKIK